ncbi:MAG TPA: hypothetical protein VLH14_01575 [Patescibacteria group bacterium]|nr:hypothetical protein [Patescibacteria group bacterium]
MADTNELLDLRNRIITDTKQLALAGQGDPQERLQVIMEMIKGGDSNPELFTAAYDLIAKIPADDDRLQESLNLLFEIDQTIGQQEGKESDDENQSQGSGGA